jgi:hypothetical protein
MKAAGAKKFRGGNTPASSQRAAAAKGLRSAEPALF